MSATRKSLAAFCSYTCFISLIGNFIWNGSLAKVLYTRGCSFGYLAAVAMPLKLPNKNVYVAFNFEANYGLPSNDSYNEWIDRWNLNEGLFGIGNNVTAINGRRLGRRHERALFRKYTRTSFYRTLIGYLEHFDINGTACLLRTICEISNDKQFDVHNGVLGSIFKILFMPTTSSHEKAIENENGKALHLYAAESHGRNGPDCHPYVKECPEGVINMITLWL